jgi:hypothetical protein
MSKLIIIRLFLSLIVTYGGAVGGHEHLPDDVSHPSSAPYGQTVSKAIATITPAQSEIYKVVSRRLKK